MTAKATRSSPTRRAAFLLLRAAVSGALLAVLAWRMEWREFTAALTGIDLRGAVFAWTIYLASQVVSARRWQGLLSAVGLNVSYGRCLAIYFEGMFFGLCLPTSLGGDVFKAYRVAPTPSQRLLTVGTVLADRVAGLLALLMIGMTALTCRLGELSLIGAAAAVLAWTLGIWLTFRGGAAAALWVCQRYWPRLVAHPVLLKLRGLHSRPAVMRRAVLWSGVVQGLNVVTVAALGGALGLKLSWSAYCVMVPLVALVSTLPVSINGMGLREGATVLILGWYGVEQAASLTLGMAWFAVILAAGLSGGLVYLAGRRGAVTAVVDFPGSLPPGERLA